MSLPPQPDPHPNNGMELPALLSRPLPQRVAEYKYRCAQAAIFGLPVVALQYFGRRLGGGPQESERWIALMQAVLGGWVVYVGAGGMLFEGLLLARWRFTMNFVVAAVSTAAYLFSLVSALGVFFVKRPFYGPLLFHWAVIVLGLWCAVQWWRLSRAGSNFAHRL